MSLVENVLSLENEANAMVAQAHTQAKELEKLAIAEVEAYRRRLAEETDQKILAFQKEMEEKHQRSVSEAEKDLTRTLSGIDEIESEVLKEQIKQIVIRFSEL